MPFLRFQLNNGGGIADNTSFAGALQLPELPGVVMELTGIALIRTLGNLLADGDAMLVGISHRTDILTANLIDDFDDFFNPSSGESLPDSMWWVSSMSFEDHHEETFPLPIDVAGPQTLIIHNATGAVAAVAGILYYRLKKVSLPAWTLLKTLTSYELKG